MSLLTGCFTCLFPSVNSLNDLSSSNLTLQHPEDFNDQSEIRLLQGFRIAHLNVNRLLNKLDYVKEFVNKHSIDILTLSQTWLTPDIMDDEVTLQGFSLARKDRVSLVKSCGGGVMIFCSRRHTFCG